jgi:hypothetical protein
MLGRLRMTLEECIDAYVLLSEKIFEKKSHSIRINGKFQGRFDSMALEQAVKQTLADRGMDDDTLLKDSPDAACKVYVPLVFNHLDIANQEKICLRDAQGD